MERSAIAGSVGVHVVLAGVVGAMVMWCGGDRRIQRRDVRVELVELPRRVKAETVVEAPKSQVVTQPRGGGSRKLAPRPRPRPTPAPSPSPSPTPTPMPMPMPSPSPSPSTTTTTSTITSTGGGGGGGIGHGTGNGTGDGIGDGRGGGAPAVAKPIARVAKVSLARPAKLIYPKRQGDEQEGRMFLVLLTVDADGYVVGAKMKGGPRGRRGEKAADAVWRFRYDPARDERGRKIRSQVEQPFILLD